MVSRAVAEGWVPPREPGEIEHGTYGGYHECRQRVEGSCADCREANRTYLRAWRKRNREAQALIAAKQGARDKALRRLADLHPVAFGALYAEELALLADRGAECG